MSSHVKLSFSSPVETISKISRKKLSFSQYSNSYKSLIMKLIWILFCYSMRKIQTIREDTGLERSCLFCHTCTTICRYWFLFCCTLSRLWRTLSKIDMSSVWVLRFFNLLHCHPAGRALTSDWYENSFAWLCMRILSSVRISCPKHD